MPIYEFKIAVRISVKDCERGDLNPHALRHRILSPARLPFRHSRVIAHFAMKVINIGNSDPDWQTGSRTRRLLWRAAKPAASTPVADNRKEW
jgi:hypothetical protein